MDVDSDRETTSLYHAYNPLSDVLPRILKELSHLNLSDRVEFRETRVLATGTFSDISKAQCLLPGKGNVTVAVKRLRFYIGVEIKILFEKEIYVWSKLTHPNILPLLGFAIDEPTGFPLLVSEWMSKGSAWAYVNSNPNLDVMHIVIGIAEGLAYLHKENVVHSDIKPDNVVISDSGDALICDFGCARMVAASWSIARPSSGMKGTARYTAVELLTHLGEGISPGYSKKSDVWSFGMTIYELLMRQRPYSHLREAQVPFAITRLELPLFPLSLNTNISRHLETKATLSKVCKNCWVHDPSERSDIETILRELRIAQRRLATENMRNRKARKTKQNLLAYSPTSPFISFRFGGSDKEQSCMSCPTCKASLNSTGLEAPLPPPAIQSFRSPDESAGASSFSSEVADAFRVAYANNDGNKRPQIISTIGESSTRNFARSTISPSRLGSSGEAHFLTFHTRISSLDSTGLDAHDLPPAIQSLSFQPLDEGSSGTSFSSEVIDALRVAYAENDGNQRQLTNYQRDDFKSRSALSLPGEVESDGDGDHHAECSKDIERHLTDLRWRGRMKKVLNLKSILELELDTRPKSLHPF